MRNYLFALLIIFAAAFSALAGDLRNAVVRIPSHGASGTVILSEKGRTRILTCGHAFPNDKEFVIDCPWDNTRVKGGKLIKLDHELDLALIEVADGPWPEVCPIADKDYTPQDKNLWAVGYPEMKWPISKQQTTLIHNDGKHLFTDRKPIPGESGGGLLDLDKGVLIGVTRARFDPPVGRGHGLYVHFNSVLSFLSDVKVKKDEKPLGFLFPYMSLSPF